MRSALRLASAGALLLSALAGCSQPVVCKPGQNPTPTRAQPSAAAGQLVHTHAHNDYEHTHPLQDALDQRFYSVEADIFYDSGHFKVAHSVVEASKGTLKDLYLDPLQALVTQKGSVYGDGVPFTLWIDIKDSDDKFPTALRDLLDQYPMLTRFTDTQVTPGPVTAVLTGDAGMKAKLVALPDRRATRDSNDYKPDDPQADNAWRYYALNWPDYLSWNGDGAIPADQQQRLSCIMENAHAAGRQVRFYGTPDKASVWKTSLEYGVDFINTDKLAELHDFLVAQP